MSFNKIITTNSQITNVESFLNNKTMALVSPKTSPGICGFVFDISEKEQIDLVADITDNYTEDNSFINDHRVKKPIKVTLSGFIGELVIKQEFFNLVLESLQSALTTVDAYLGSFTDGVTQTIQTIFSTTVSAISRTTQTIDRVKNIVSGFNGEGQYENLQQRAYSNLEALYNSETVLTVQTPWRYFDSMMIENIQFVQGEESEYISDISVTLKEIRFAQIGITNYENNLNANRNELQSKSKVNTGKIQGSRNSFLFDGASAAGGKF